MDTPNLADETFVALKRLGKPVEYARYEGEGHWEGWWSEVNQLDYVTRVIAWFTRYLLPEAQEQGAAR